MCKSNVQPHGGILAIHSLLFIIYIYIYNRKHFFQTKIQFVSLHIKYIQNEKRLRKGKQFNIFKRYDTNTQIYIFSEDRGIKESATLEDRKWGWWST